MICAICCCCSLFFQELLCCGLQLWQHVFCLMLTCMYSIYTQYMTQEEMSHFQHVQLMFNQQLSSSSKNEVAN